MTLKRNTVYMGLAAAGLFAILIFVFQNFISTRYYYMGFVPRANSDGYAVELFGLGYIAELLAFLALLLLINQLRSTSVKILLILQVVVPVLSVYLLHANGIASTYTLVLCTAAVVLVTVISMGLKIRHRWTISKSQNSLILVGIIVILFYLGALITDRGIGNIVLSFSDVYEYRAETESSYLVSLLRSAAVTFAAVLFACALVTGRRWLSVFCIGAFIIFFIYSGHKRFIFLIPFIYLAYAAIRADRPYYIVLLYLVAIAIATLAFLGLDSTALLNFIARRSIMIPGLLTQFYVEYFSDYEPLWFSHSKIGVLLNTYDPSIPPPAKLVGTRFFTEGSNANANWIASSYMNMGSLGIFIYAPLVAILFSLPGALLKKRNEQVFLTSGIVVYSSFMQNSDLIASFLSNGVAVFVLTWIIWGNMDLGTSEDPANKLPGKT